MAYGEKPTTCAHQIVLGLCVMFCLGFGAWPRPVQGLRELQATRLAQRLALTLVLQVPGMCSLPDPDQEAQLTTAASTRGSWPRRMLLSPNN
jgi:hypothetical protein